MSFRKYSIMKRFILLVITSVLFTIGVSHQNYSQNKQPFTFELFTKAGQLDQKYYPIGWSENERYFAILILVNLNMQKLEDIVFLLSNFRCSDR